MSGVTGFTATLEVNDGGNGGVAGGASTKLAGLVIDVINLVHAIPSIPEADPERIGMWGHSMAGNLVLRAMSR